MRAELAAWPGQLPPRRALVKILEDQGRTEEARAELARLAEAGDARAREAQRSQGSR